MACRGCGLEEHQAGCAAGQGAGIVEHSVQQTVLAHFLGQPGLVVPMSRGSTFSAHRRCLAQVWLAASAA